MPYLQYPGPDGKLVQLPLVRRLTTIGSSPECDVVIQGFEVAASHATLSRDPGRFRLESTARANPFFVGGKKTRSHDLRHGDIFVIGEVELSFSTLEVVQERSDDHALTELQLGAMRRLQEFSRLLTDPGDLDARRRPECRHRHVRERTAAEVAQDRQRHAVAHDG